MHARTHILSLFPLTLPLFPLLLRRSCHFIVQGARAPSPVTPRASLLSWSSHAAHRHWAAGPPWAEDLTQSCSLRTGQASQLLTLQVTPIWRDLPFTRDPVSRGAGAAGSSLTRVWSSIAPLVRPRPAPREAAFPMGATAGSRLRHPQGTASAPPTLGPWTKLTESLRRHLP